MTNEEVAAIMAARTYTGTLTTLNFDGDQFLVLPADKRQPYVANCGNHDDARAIAVAVNEWDLLEAVRKAADFRASVEFERGWHGADMLDAIAAYMDRKDDEAEAVDGFARDRSVQRDVRRWASGLRTALAALDAHREAQK